MTGPSVTSSADRGTEEEHAADHVLRPCVLSGEIRAPGVLCDVISFLAHAAWWGELIVTSGETMRSLFFDEGHVVGAESNVADERLGEVLGRHAALTREQVDLSSARASERHLRFGEAVVELGFLTRERLFELMPKQVEDIFCGIGAIETGQFVFLDGFDDGVLSFRQKRSADGLLLDAIRRMDEKRCFASRIPSDEYVPVRRTDGPPPADDPFGVYEAIDGTRNVAELAASVGLAEIDVTRALFLHMQTGHAMIKPPRLGPRKTIEIYNDAVVVLLRELDAVEQGDAVRAQLATFASAAPSTLFLATPARDGTFDASEVAERIARASDPTVVEDQLGRWLYDYASYAVFLARPHLERSEQAPDPSSPRVSGRVAALLAPLHPSGAAASAESEIPAASPSPRLTVPVAGPPSDASPSAVRTPPPAASTLRMRKAFSTGMPGVNPARTTRMAPVAVDALVAARGTKQSPAFRVRHAAFQLPGGEPNDVAVGGPTSPSPPRSRAVVAAALAVSCLVIGVLVGARSQLFQSPRGPVVTPSAVTKNGPHGATTLVVVCEPACASVFVDGKPVAQPFEPIALAPGSHDVVVHREGYTQQLKRVGLNEGESQAVSFLLTAHPR